MNQKELEKAKERYKILIKEREDLLTIKDEIKELEKNPQVKKYLELKSCNKRPLNDEGILYYSFNQVLNDNKKEDKIYVYMGAYKYNYDYSSDSQVEEKSYKNADYILYANIETVKDKITIVPKDKENFENRHTIIKFENAKDIKRKYHFLQLFYFNELLEKGLISKEESVKLLQKKMENLRY